MRGRLTDAIVQIGVSQLGRTIDTTELRLYAYIDYSLKNGGLMNPAHINADDRKVLQSLRDAGFITFTLSIDYTPAKIKIECSKAFYDAMQSILWVSYVVPEFGHEVQA